MGKDMEEKQDFKKVKAYFENLGDDHKDFDLDAFYDKKTKKLKSVQNIYHKMKKKAYSQ